MHGCVIIVCGVLSVLRAEAVTVIGCQNGTLRLSNGQGGVGGVEVCLNNTWGSVCSNGPTDPSTISVVCRKLGYSVQAASVYPVSAVGPGASVQCSGRENSLFECSVSFEQVCNQLNVNCSGGVSSPCPNQYQCWSEVFCISSTYLCDGISDCVNGFDESNCPSLGTCSPGDIRLADGTDYFGRVEVCTSSRSYATMVDTQWNVLDASVACRQLNKNFSGGIPIPVQPGTGPTALFAVDCNGKETNLYNCAMSTSGLGTNPHAVGILCSVTAGCQDGDLRLVGGAGPREGQVEVCYNGIWGRICSQTWPYDNAAVVCRQLGYNPSGAIPLTYRYFGVYAAPILMGTMFCSGREALLVDCTVFVQLGSQNENQTQACTSFDHVGVRCDDYQPTGCTDGSARLSERSTPGSGKLQICLNSTWSEFCSIGPGPSGANVVCRQLGFVGGYSWYSSTANSHPQAYLVLNCSGTEGNLLQCVRGVANSSSCYTGSVYVQCSELYAVFNPSIPSTYTLQPNQPFDLSCMASGSGTPRVVGYYNQSGFQTPIGFTNRVDLLSEVQLTNQVVCGCIVTNGVEIVATNVTLMVATPTGDRSDAFWRGSIPAIARVIPSLGLQTSAQFLNFFAQLFVNGASAFPGLWVATCSSVMRQEVDIARDLDRIECSISSYGSNLTDQVYPPFSMAVDVARLVQVYVSVHLFSLLSFTAVSKYPFCDANVTASPQGKYSWPEALGDSLNTQPCAFGPDGSSASRRCTLNGSWQAPDLRYCATFTTSQLTKLSSVVLDSQNIVQVTQALVDGVSMSDLVDQTPHNLAVVGDVLNQTAALLQNTSDIAFLATAQQVAEKVVVILDHLQGWPQASVAQQSSEIVHTFENILTGLVQNSNFTSFMTSAKAIAVDAEKIGLNDAVVNGRQFTASNGAAGINVNMNSSGAGDGAGTGAGAGAGARLVSVSLPGSLFRMLATGPHPSSVGVLITLYSTAALFPLRSINNSFINSPVVGASVVVNSSIRSISGLVDPIQIDLSFTTTNNMSFNNPRCVFWDYTAAGGQGNWSDGGCRTVLIGKDSVRCECSHLTNFACLVDIGARTGDTSVTIRSSQQSLQVLSVVGVLLSLIGLTITMTTFALFKKIRDKDSSKLHIQLCAAMFCMFAVFLFGIGLDKAGEKDFGITIDKTMDIGGCVAVSVLVQYFTLVTFLVMAAESLLMFHKLVVVFVQITSRHHVVTSLVCWSLPLVPVIVPLTIDRNYLITKPDNITGEEGYCFISHVGVFFGVFLAPILAIILFNSVIFTIVTIVLVKHTLRKSGHRKLGRTVRLMVVIAGLTLLFGLTWVFGALTVSGTRLAFSVLFIVTNAFQGFYIFLVFCAFSTDAQEAWSRLLCKGSLSAASGPQTSHGRSISCGRGADVPTLHTPSHQLQSLTSATCAEGRNLIGETSVSSSAEESLDDLNMKGNSISKEEKQRDFP